VEKLSVLKNKIADLKIMFVEDEESVRESLYDILKRLFSNIIVAKDGQEGVAKCMSEKPDIVITDINMPVMSGLDMVKEIKKSDLSLPIIFLSASTDVKHFSQAVNLNADGFVLKPLVHSHLLEVIEKTVDNIIARKLAQKYKNELETRVEEEMKKNIETVKMLKQQSKLAQMGEMIGAVIHHWRQPLSIINQITQDISDTYRYGELDEAYIDESTEKILYQVRYLFDNIEDLRSFFKPDKAKKEFSVIHIFEAVLTFMKKHFLSNGIEIDIVEKQKEINLFGYSDEFKQVIINLLSNSKEAFLRNPDIKNKKVYVEIAQDDDFTTVMIKDNAGGVDEEVLEHIFEAYYTTKAEVEGAGIGLFISKVIIENSFGGSISARNADDGAEFLIRLSREIEG